MQCPNCGAIINYQVDICPNCTYALIQPPAPYQQMQQAPAQMAYQQAVHVPLQPQQQQASASSVGTAAAQFATQGASGLKRMMAGRASIQWIALAAVALMLVCAVGPWFVTSSRYAAAAGVTDGVLQFLGLGGSGSYSLAPVYYGFQFPVLANTIANGSTFSNGGDVAIAVWFFFALWISGFIVTIIGAVITLKKKAVKRVPLIVGAALMAACAGLWSIEYSVDMVGNGVANGTPAPILCLITAIASIVLVIVAGSKKRNSNKERNA